jgi:HEAT repeat protein
MILHLLLAAAFAQAPPGDPQDASQNPMSSRYGTPLDYAGDLLSGDKADRLFAARELRRQAESAARKADGKPSDAQLEARVWLADLHDDTFTAATRAVVEHADVRAPLAEMLAALGDPAALPALEQALAAEDREAVRKRVQASIDALRSSS